MKQRQTNNGSIRKREVTQPQQHTEYYLFNSQGNLKAYSDDIMSFAYYGYNASNTRTYKISLNNTNVWINGQPQALHMQLQQAMFYPNTYLNFDAFGNYTKHYYNGMERIASRLGDNTTTIAINNNILENRKLQLEEQFRVDIHKLIEETVPIDLPPFIDVNALQPTGTPNDIYYYHPNHLGSTSFVTDNNATITQGFLYAPFGEITTEYNINFGNNVIPKYSFNAKELDEETGMYYYEARYYAPPTFTSRDPLFEKYFWMSPYAYCANNPVKYVDPSGEDIEATDDIVIIGKNNSSITVKTDVVDIKVNTNIDFGGNHEVDASRVAVGYERGVGATAEAGTGFGGSASVTSMMFLGGDFAGYWYDYAGGEAQAGMTLGLDVSAGIQANLVLGIYMGNDRVTPESFGGNYIEMCLSGGAKAFGGIEGNISVSRSKKWKTFSIGGKVTVGASAGIKASTSGNVGGLKLLTPEVPTKNRSMFDKAFNWISHLLRPFKI